MNPEDMIFEEFFAERMKQKGLTLKKLTELTGISPQHLHEIAQGNFEALPSSPYVRGYLIRLGTILDFDGEAWWQKIKDGGRVKNSGSYDAMPRNRFLKKSPLRKILWSAFGLIVVVILIAQFPRIVGKPSIVVTYPTTTPFVTGTNLITLAGTVSEADTISVNGDVATISKGAWQENVLLQDGVNTFDISAKKFLGGETDVTEEIIYQPSGVSGNGSSTSITASSSDATSAGATSTTP